MIRPVSAAHDTGLSDTPTARARVGGEINTTTDNRGVAGSSPALASNKHWDRQDYGDAGVADRVANRPVSRAERLAMGAFAPHRMRGILNHLIGEQ